MREKRLGGYGRHRRREQLRKDRRRKRADAKREGTPVPNELENAWKLLTEEQVDMVRARWRQGEYYGVIACRLGLTRSAVHSLVRRLNQGKDA